MILLRSSLGVPPCTTAADGILLARLVACSIVGTATNIDFLSTNSATFFTILLPMF